MIKIEKASENNLKKISINIPLHKITAITGVSGSGKSSLIYNVLARESLRLEKIDSGNAKKLDYAIRPDFEKISDLPYCVILNQRGLSESISSTIGTATGLHELLRNEFVQYGKIVGLNGREIYEPTCVEIESFITKYYPSTDFKYYAVVADRKFTDGISEMSFLLKNDIKEAIFISSLDCKDKLRKIDLSKPLNKKYSHTILLPINKLSDISKYEHLALCNFLIDSSELSLRFNTDFFDIDTGIIYQKKSQHLLSFNSVNDLSGKCLTCCGHGRITHIDIEKLILNNVTMSGDFLNLEINDNGCYKYIFLCRDVIDGFLKKEMFPRDKTFDCLSIIQQDKLLSFLSEKLLKHKKKPSISKYIKDIICPDCMGTRLNYKANAIKLYDKNISELLGKTVDQLYDFLITNNSNNKKIISILYTLKKTTLGYLSLERSTTNLSGGELQRLKISLEMNSQYKNLLYILDEPSTGLHQYNNRQMIQLIRELCNKNNTVIISEHNSEYIEASDYVIELGPGGGVDGGHVVYEGRPKKIEKEHYVRDKICINHDNSMELVNVNINNIVNQSFIIPLNCLVSISGVSGCGKSSLIHNGLIPCIKQYLFDQTYDTSIIEVIKNIDKVKRVFELTQSQIGINSRSVVATYLNIFDDIRDVFSSLDLSKQFGLNKSHFSFNNEEGACVECKGMGDIEGTICSSCLGQRYKAEILSVHCMGLNIYDFLNAPLCEVLNLPITDKIKFAINTLYKLGLSYIQLGRVTSTLSGGEAQRVRLAKMLIDSFKDIEKGSCIFIFDEPTTGLDNTDLSNLYSIFSELLKYENSIIVIEHNLEFIKNSDFIIDIGLGSGSNGGRRIFSGKYSELIANTESITAATINGLVPISFELDSNHVILKDKIYNKQEKPNCNSFYTKDEHFQVEKTFHSLYSVQTDSASHFYFKSKEELFSFVSELKVNKILFNPYTTDLFKYKKIPTSIKKERIFNLKDLGYAVSNKDTYIDEWFFRVQTDCLEFAYNFGHGWITLVCNEQRFELFTRLVSIENKLIGSPKVTTETFNLYCNGCDYCKSEGFLKTYDFNLIISDKSKSILCDGFFKQPFKFKLRGVVNKFKKEGLFDFTKPFIDLNDEEKNILFFGFMKYSFLKPNGKPTTLSDYISWDGLNYYISEHIDDSDVINKSLHSVICPFCSKGFNSEVLFYQVEGENITDYII